MHTGPSISADAGKTLLLLPLLLLCFCLFMPLVCGELNVHCTSAHALTLTSTMPAKGA